MSKVEQFFNRVDFSGETDFKDQLRKQLFENNKKSISEQDSLNWSDDINGRTASARQLSLDELGLVNAAGNPAIQQQNQLDRLKSKQPLEGQGENPWDNTFSGKITDHNTGE